MSYGLHAFASPPRDDSKLIKMMKRAHAIEVGAYHAYEGHFRSIKPLTNPNRGEIKMIQVDEKIHKEELARMLSNLGSQQNYLLDATFYLIGRFISAACYVMPARWSNLGALMMEKLADPCYAGLAEEAKKQGRYDMQSKFLEMRKSEEEHHEFFDKLLTNDPVHDRPGIWHHPDGKGFNAWFPDQGTANYKVKIKEKV